MEEKKKERNSVVKENRRYSTAEKDKSSEL